MADRYRGIDAAFIDSQNWEAFDFVFVYGSAFGSQQGPYRATPPDFIRTVNKPVWMIYFPGAALQSCLTEATSYPNVVGVAMDLETKWEGDAWSRQQCVDFGDFFNGHLPRALYSHRVTCDELVPGHYDASWFAGENQDAELGANDAVQWGYEGNYDESAGTVWWLRPSGAVVAPDDPIQMVSQGDGSMLLAVTVHTGADGNGNEPTDIPWSRFRAATFRANLFPQDAWSPGQARATDFNNNVLVGVYGARPNFDEVVWLDVADA